MRRGEAQKKQGSLWHPSLWRQCLWSRRVPPSLQHFRHLPCRHCYRPPELQAEQEKKIRNKGSLHSLTQTAPPLAAILLCNHKKRVSLAAFCLCPVSTSRFLAAWGHPRRCPGKKATGNHSCFHGSCSFGVLLQLTYYPLLLILR